MKKSTVLLAAAIPAAAYIGWRLGAQTSTEPYDNADSIAELRPVCIRGTELWTMIRGRHRDNPVIVWVTGGPCGTEIPICRKYDRQLEEYFTVVHYDQRGAGKSFEFGRDYSTLTADVHAADLLALAEYLTGYLGKDKLILVGHSYGTYIGTLAAAARPELFRAYVGIGQMADTKAGEILSAERCLSAAVEAGNDRDVRELKKALSKVRRGEIVAPRKYVRKYGFAERKNHHEVRDLLCTVFFGREYNLTDGIKFLYAASRYAMPLAMEAMGNPISGRVKELKVPAYILMGKYDGMTSTSAAKTYYCQLKRASAAAEASEGSKDAGTGGSTADAAGAKAAGPQEFVIFENSAHSPQIEENKAFTDWMIKNFAQ